MTPEWVHQLINYTKRIVPKEFFGKVEINIQGGGISNINLITSIKDMEGSDADSRGAMPGVARERPVGKRG